MFSAVGIFGGYVVGVLMIGIDPGQFWSQMQGGVDVWDDVGKRHHQEHRLRRDLHLCRAARGLRGQRDPEGVAQATTRTVVISSLAVAAARFRVDRGDVLDAALVS